MMADHPLTLSEKLNVLKNSRPGDTVKIDVTDLKCTICQEKVNDIENLTKHLHEIHSKPIIEKFDTGVVPYLLNDGFTCAICNESFERFIALNTHVFHHFPKNPCSVCGVMFSAERLRKHMLRVHGKNQEMKLKPNSFDGRHNAIIILECSNVSPFKWHRNVFGCAYCSFTSADFSNIKTHLENHSAKTEKIKILRYSRPTDVIKADVTDLICDICQKSIEDVTSLMYHLKDIHGKPIIQKYGPGIIPYFLDGIFKCAYKSCGKSFDWFIPLNTHVKSHNLNCICTKCGQYFTNAERLHAHKLRVHCKSSTQKLSTKSEAGTRIKSMLSARNNVDCFDDARHNAAILLEFSNVCVFKWDRNVFKCMSCEFTSADFHPIRTHVHTKDLDSLFTRHSRPVDVIKAEVTGLKCNVCDQPSQDLKSLLNHLGEIHDKPIKKEFKHGLIPYLLMDNYTCAECGIQFDRFTKLNFHMNKHFPNCICSICGRGFTNSNRLHHHIRQHKKKKEEIKCSSCMLTFQSRHQKQKHMFSEHGQAPHKCPYCSEVFLSYPLRLQHLNDAHGKKIEYPCKLCTKVFQNASKRASHVRYIHMKDKPYSCTICNYVCMTPTLLKHHMVCHNGEKKYKCKVCNKAFSRSGTLCNHMRIHNNDKRFVCAHCNAAFVQKSSLTSHIKSHHPYDNPQPSSSYIDHELEAKTNDENVTAS